MTTEDWPSTLDPADPWEALEACPDCGFFVRPGEAGHGEGTCTPGLPTPRRVFTRETCPDCLGFGSTLKGLMCDLCVGSGVWLSIRQER